MKERKKEDAEQDDDILKHYTKEARDKERSVEIRLKNLEKKEESLKSWKKAQGKRQSWKNVDSKFKTIKVTNNHPPHQ